MHKIEYALFNTCSSLDCMYITFEITKKLYLQSYFVAELNNSVQRMHQTPNLIHHFFVKALLVSKYIYTPE